MKVIKIQYYKSSFGKLILGSYQGKLCLADWHYRKMRKAIDQRIQNGLGAEYCEEESQITNLAKKQIEAFIGGKRTDFDIPLLLLGTDFQKRVWHQLMNISFGYTMTYRQLSEMLGDVKAIRAVASANGANAISIIVPCHRIIGSDGKLVGYAGGLETKRKLLNLEGSLLEPTLF